MFLRRIALVFVVTHFQSLNEFIACLLYTSLYHDIGKMVNPAFFTENQSGVNPHKSLSYEQSAQVIISHITDGLKLAEKHNLPKVIKDFISTHHGRGLTLSLIHI